MAESGGCKRRWSGDVASGTELKRVRNDEEDEETTLRDQQQLHAPRLSRTLQQQCEPITAADLSQLLQYATLGESHGTNMPSWCQLHHQKRVSGVHVVVLEGLTQLAFYHNYSQFKRLRSKYNTRCTLTPPAGELLSALFNADLPEPLISYPPTAAVTLHPVVRRYGLKKRGLRRYLLPEEEMMKKHFPVQGAQGCEGFVCTKADGRVTDDSPLYGLDCEMCVTQAGEEVTRVALVDSGGCCVMDELVKPFNPIYDFRTKFSGITRSILQPVTTRLHHVQSKLLELLPGDAVLVGHSLDKDLQVLKLVHPHVIDTSLLYTREFGQKFKLKHLAHIILKKEIQSEDRTGHDPCEDACAALELAQYFISKGPREVVERHLQDLWELPPLTPPPPVNGSVPKRTSSLSCALQQAGRSALFLTDTADAAVPSGQPWRTVRCSSEEKCVCVLGRVGQCYSLSLVQLSSYTQLHRAVPAGGALLPLHQMSERLRKMCVLYVGPLPPDYTEKQLHTLLRHYGELHTLRLLHNTHTLYAVVEFVQLEGAQLALQCLHNHQINTTTIKVRRPLCEETVGMEECVSRLQRDPLSGAAVYVGGLSSRRHLQEHLLHAFSTFGPVRHVSRTTRGNGKRSRHARIEFVSPDSAAAAVSSPVQIGNRSLCVCHALTPPHMHTWTHSRPAATETASKDGGETERAETDAVTEGETERVMRALDRKLGKMFRALERGTLSVVILPGSRSGAVEFFGLCFLEVKQT